MLTGLDMDNPDALRNYYELLSVTLRVIVLAVFSRGLHNEQIMDQTRIFLTENRSSMVGIFKRYAKIGGEASSSHREVIQSLVKAYVALISGTGFVEVSAEKLAVFVMSRLLTRFTISSRTRNYSKAPNRRFSLSGHVVMFILLLAGVGGPWAAQRY